MVLKTRRKADNYRQEVILDDGSKIILRPIRPEDEEALKAFYSRLSPETCFLRYQYCRGEMSGNELKTFCDIDFDDTMALVAEKGPYGQRDIIAVGSYYRLEDPRVAEVAFLVQDSEQRKGLGTHLFKNLALYAWKNDIDRFVGEVLKENSKMLSIFRKSDPGMELVNECGSTYSVTVSVPEVIHNSWACS